KNKVVWSDKVEWDLVPYVLMGDKLLLWAEKGCNRLCRYCSTSWTDKHERNTEENFERAKIYCEKNKKLLHLVQNEFDGDITERVSFLSITVRRYLQNWGLIRRGATVRIGIEFINENVRRKYIPGKFFTDEEFMELFHRAMNAKHNLRLFCITGVESAEDWFNFFEELPELDFKTSVLFKFTPITHVMFTPFFKKRFEVDFNNYIDRERHAEWYMRNLNRAWWRTVIGGVFEGVYRTAIQLCENIEELRWLNKIKMSEMSEEKKVNEVIDSDVYKRDYQRMVEFEWWSDEMKEMVY
ncbi:MAG: hypothetical protein NZ893_02850, partial [Candidatus Aenigmarchaeota archaeon]|nr:hypothetical protein [Candidatus Aenigmarchaeota archaeon]